MPIECNTTDTASVNSMVARANFQLGGIDILVNNAARPLGQAPVPGIEGVTDDAFNEDINTKVLGYLQLRSSGRSDHERARLGTHHQYQRSGVAFKRFRGGIDTQRVGIGIDEKLADELGPFGINAVVIHPGATRTEATAEVVGRGAGESRWRIDRGRYLEEMASANSVRKLIDAREIAYVAAFVASPKASCYQWVTR